MERKGEELTGEDYQNIILGLIVLILLALTFYFFYNIAGYIFRFTKVNMNLFILYNQFVALIIFVFIIIYSIKILFKKKKLKL